MSEMSEQTMALTPEQVTALEACFQEGVDAAKIMLVTIRDRERQLAEAQARLREYEGWAPDQFLRYQEEHRKLQAEYVALDTRLHEAQARIKVLETVVAEARLLTEADDGEEFPELQKALAALDKPQEAPDAR